MFEKTLRVSHPAGRNYIERVFEPDLRPVGHEVRTQERSPPEPVGKAEAEVGGAEMSAITPTSMSSRELLTSAIPTLSGVSGVSPQRSRTAVLLGHWLVALTVSALAIVAVGAVVGAVLPRLAQAAEEPALVTGADAAVVQVAPALVEHRVVPGDTLWLLAERSAAGGDPREALDRIVRLNSLPSASLQVGDTVLLPNRG